VKIPVVEKQDIRFTQLAINGEPFSARTQAAAQDNRGFVWLGTDDAGLNRHDGYNLKSYRHDPNNPDSLSDNRIRSVFRDRDGIIWAGGEIAGSTVDRIGHLHALPA
jgi:ligand-binding sensor domain-containing protein